MMDKIINWLITRGNIDTSKRELYTFAIRYFFIAIIPIAVSIAFSILIGAFFNCIIILFIILSLRSYSGGFHFESEKMCIIISSITLCILSYSSLIIECSYIISIILIISSLSIMINSPIVHINHKVSDKEKKRYHSISFCLTMIYLTLYFVFKNLSQIIAVDLFLGIFFIAVLQIPCIIKTQLTSTQKKYLRSDD